MTEQLSRKWIRISTGCFYFLLALQIAWILTLPLFPTQDGPVHLYYAKVFSNLLSGSSLYSKYFYIRHILPPYSLHYYYLVLSTKVLAPRTAEKLLVCGLVILLATGFRFWTRSAGDRTGVISLAVLPLLFNQSLLMGFYNYYMGLGFAFWAAAYWVRASSGRRLTDWLIFLCLTYVVLLSHPVPLVLLLGFAAVDLSSRALRSWYRGRHSTGPDGAPEPGWKDYRVDFLFLIMAALSLVYVAAFINSTQTARDLLPPRSWADGLKIILKASPVAAFAGAGLATVVYRLGLWAVLAVSLWISCKGLLKRLGRLDWGPADLFLLLGLPMIVLFPWIPPSINGSGYFAERLAVAAWLVCAASAAGKPLSQWKARVSLALSVSFTFLVLWMAQTRIAPTAANLTEIERVNVDGSGRVGLLLCSSSPDTGLAVQPYWWAGVEYFSNANAILLDSPWLESHYLMVAGKAPLMTTVYPKEILGEPVVVTYTIAGSTSLEDKYMRLSDLIVLTKGPASPSTALADIGARLTGISGRKWQLDSGSWFDVYRAQR